MAVGLVGLVLASGCSSGLQGASANAPAASGTTNDGTAPARGRVDLDTPTFSDPTTITNPLFPITDVTQAIQLGAEGDEALRHEITLLDETRFIRWNGQRIETIASQFVAYGDGRVLEVATDYFAQDDDGNVWYFGEHVDNYENGVIANNDGTWLAGRDGPPGMIMPADPQVGDVYRPENIPGLVFEEVTVKEDDMTVDGPRGPVHGAIKVQEALMDGTLEDKVFAPGYGEFEARVASSDELVTVALAVPTDQRRGAVPRNLSRVSTGATNVFELAPSGQWDRISRRVDGMVAAWEDYRQDGVPELLDAQTSDVLEALDAAVASQDAAEVRQAAIDASHAGLDLELQHRRPAEVDEDRLDVWRRQVAVDRAARDAAAVAGDRAILATIEHRIDDD